MDIISLFNGIIRKNRVVYNLFRLFVIMIPFFLYLVPLEWLVKQHTICIYKNITGRDCYGCGITRAVLSVLHFDFEKAFNYNRLIIIVFPLLIYIWIKTIISMYKEDN